MQLDMSKQKFMTAFMLHEEEFEKMVMDAVDKAFSERNIEEEIENQVNKAISNAIESISKDYEIQKVITKLVRDTLYEFCNKK